MIKALEFFSGIGAMHYALLDAVADAQVLASFDISPLANEWLDYSPKLSNSYHYNFNKLPIQLGIDHLSVDQITKFGANCWLLSPPCQPYTRVGKMLDTKDERAKGLLHLIHILSLMDEPPSFIFLENVCNFEKSKSRDMMVETILKRGYVYHEWILTPSQIGMPNDRPRYYLIAKKMEGKGVCEQIPAAKILMDWPNKMPSRKVGEFLDVHPDLEALEIPTAFLKKRAFISQMTIAHPDDNRTSCFTKAYGHYGLRSGSFLQTRGERSEEMLDKPVVAREALGLRMFSPEEIARLHAFPVDVNERTTVAFKFPPHLSQRQRWKLIGNSMNVKVVSVLLEHLFKE